MKNILRVCLGDIARRHDVAVPADATLTKAFSLMLENGIGAVVVLDGSHAIGVLTERDATRLICKDVDLNDRAESHVRKVLIVARDTRTFGYALSVMVENNIRRLVVVDAAYSFRGLVTQQELLKNIDDDHFRANLEVRHILDQTRTLIFAHLGESIAVALRRMVHEGVSAVPILEGGAAVGIITEKDSLRLTRGSRSLDDPVESYMSKPVVTVPIDMRLTDVARLMNEKSVRRVVVVGPDGCRAVGLLTNRDLVRSLQGSYKDYLERRLRHTKEVLNLLPDLLLEIIDMGEEQFVVWGNERAVAGFGRDIVDRPVTDFVPPDRWREIYPLLVEQGRVSDVRFRHGTTIFELSGYYLPLERGLEKGRIQVVMRNMTEEVSRAVSDPLTGLYTQRYIDDFLAREIKRSRRDGRAISVIVAAVDDFSGINDASDRSFGDKLLQEVAGIIGGGSREYDVVGRCGEEEFVIVMPETSMRRAVTLVNRVRRGLEKHVFEPAPGKRISVTASFGVSVFEKDGETAEDLLARANARLCRARSLGRNRIVSS